MEERCAELIPLPTTRVVSGHSEGQGVTSLSADAVPSTALANVATSKARSKEVRRAPESTAGKFYCPKHRSVSGDGDNDETRRKPFNAPKKEYYSFINPGIDMCMDYSSQLSLKSRDSAFVDRELLSKLYYVPQPLTEKDSRPQRQAFKNLTVLGVAFMFVFTGFVSLQSLQSTLNGKAGLGVASLCCLYTATVLSCFFAPAVIKRLTTKWTLVAAFSLFLVYIATNFYPEGVVLIPASILLGCLTGPLWSAQSTYLTTIAIRYAQATQQTHDAVLIRFNGIFGGIFQTSQVWGHIISAAILSTSASGTPAHVGGMDSGIHLSFTSGDFTQDDPSIQAYVSANLSMGARCGALDCGVHDFPPDALDHHLSPVPYATRTLLLAIHLGCVLTGVILTTTLLDKTQTIASDITHPVSLSSQQLFFATLRMLQDYRMQLLLPLVVFTGLQQGFVFGDFTKSYVNCALGIHAIGSVMICFGAVTAISSFAIGYASKHIKRFPIMTSGTLFNAGLLIALLWWRPRHDDPAMFYVVSGCLGMCDAIWQTQTNALFGVLFTDRQEAAFASYRMLQAVGFAVAFGYSYFLCVETKVYIMAGVLLVALLLYSIIEYKLHQQKKRTEGVVQL